MSDSNINPYFDEPRPQEGKPVIDAPPLPVVRPLDTGIPAWMPISALFVGLGLFAIVVVGAFTLTGKETPPTQAAHQEGTTPEKQTSAQPDEAAGAAQRQQQNQAAQAPQGQQLQAQPATPNPTSTSGTAPNQQ